MPEFKADANKFVLRDDISLRIVQSISYLQEMVASYQYRDGEYSEKKIEFLKHFFGLYQATIFHLKNDDKDKYKTLINMFLNRKVQGHELIKAFMLYHAALVNVGLAEIGREHKGNNKNRAVRT